MLLGVLAASLLLGLLARSIEVGIGKIPFTTTDSRGRPMGFNDPLGREHLSIILKAVEPADLFRRGGWETAYFAFWLAMHGAGAWIVLRFHPARPKPALAFFALQAPLFPTGVIGAVILPGMLQSMSQGKFDRESIVDIPFFPATGHTVWLVACFAAIAVLFLAHRRHEWRGPAGAGSG